MKQIFVLLTLALAICGCQPQASKSDNAATETVVNQTPDPEIVKQRVQEIYSEVFKVYNEEDSLRNLDIQMENGVFEHRNEFNKSFCSEEWNSLLAKVNEIDSLNHEGELGFWEDDYWIMGQDWHELSVSDVHVVSVDDTIAVVELNLHNCGNTIPVKLNMACENGKWQIDNFVDVANDLDWKSSMQQYIEEETTKGKR